MEHQKILNLFNEADNIQFVTINCNIVNGQSNVSYKVGNEIVYSTDVLKSNLSDYSNAYILLSIIVIRSIQVYLKLISLL